MTRNEALQIATETINALDIANCFNDEQQSKIAEALAVIGAMREQLSKKRVSSDETKAKRKEATATARAALLAAVMPVVRSIAVKPMTAKEIFTAGEGMWPVDFTAPKLQNVLIREMAPELDKVEIKGFPNTYCVKG